MVDFYGFNWLIVQGCLLFVLVVVNLCWLCLMVGIFFWFGYYLYFIVFEIGCGLDGNWWVLLDWIEVFLGVGYVLENCVVILCVFVDVFIQQNVYRLVGFFCDFCDWLMQVCVDRDVCIVILIFGLLNEIYYEYVWIVCYLGFMLVQGDDLVVYDGWLMVCIVVGLQLLDILWWCMDGEYVDLLEFVLNLYIGMFGMVLVLWCGGLMMVNLLGLGVLEVCVMMVFLLQFLVELIGVLLMMFNIVIWWLGGVVECDVVLCVFECMVLSGVLEIGLFFDCDIVFVKVVDLSCVDLEVCFVWQGVGLVVQEMVMLLIMFVLIDGQFQLWLFLLWVFLVCGVNGWQVMLGGFVCIGVLGDLKVFVM